MRSKARKFTVSMIIPTEKGMGGKEEKVPDEKDAWRTFQLFS